MTKSPTRLSFVAPPVNKQSTQSGSNKKQKAMTAMVRNRPKRLCSDAKNAAVADAVSGVATDGNSPPVPLLRTSLTTSAKSLSAGSVRTPRAPTPHAGGARASHAPTPYLSGSRTPHAPTGVAAKDERVATPSADDDRVAAQPPTPRTPRVAAQPPPPRILRVAGDRGVVVPDEGDGGATAVVVHVGEGAMLQLSLLNECRGGVWVVFTTLPSASRKLAYYDIHMAPYARYVRKIAIAEPFAIAVEGPLAGAVRVSCELTPVREEAVPSTRGTPEPGAPTATPRPQPLAPHKPRASADRRRARLVGARHTSGSDADSEDVEVDLLRLKRRSKSRAVLKSQDGVATAASKSRGAVTTAESKTRDVDTTVTSKSRDAVATADETSAGFAAAVKRKESPSPHPPHDAHRAAQLPHDAKRSATPVAGAANRSPPVLHRDSGIDGRRAAPVSSPPPDSHNKHLSATPRGAATHAGGQQTRSQPAASSARRTQSQLAATD